MAVGVARHDRVVLPVVAALVAGALVWSTDALQRPGTSGDPYASVDTQLARDLQDDRARLHADIGRVRAEDPGTTGLEALNDLSEATGRRFRFRALEADGTTLAEVASSATLRWGFLKRQESWVTSVCLSLAVEPGRGVGRGSVTTEQIPCAPDAPPPRRGPDGEAGGLGGTFRPATVELGRLRTEVPAPTPTPARDRRVICYSGSSCEESGG